MEVRSFDDAGAFLRVAGPLALADPARNNLLLGICGALRDQPGMYDRFHLWAAFDDAGAVAGAALMTEPYGVVLCEPATGEAVEALAEGVPDSAAPVPGVVANVPWAERFARRWSELTGATSRVTMLQGIYELRAVESVAPAPGAPRVASVRDRSLLHDWLVAFGEEALRDRPDDRERVGRSLDIRLEDGDDTGFWLWERDGRAVSMSGHTTILGGSRIGPVYTPPSERGKGYATNLVAAESAWLLERGSGPCFLYTDLANPTSNAIYMRIGYGRICDSEDRAFVRG